MAAGIDHRIDGLELPDQADGPIPEASARTSRRRSLMATSIALLALCFAHDPIFNAFVSSEALRPQLFQPGRSHFDLQVMPKGHTGDGIILIMPKAKGFLPADRPKVQDVQSVVPGLRKQKVNFFDKVKAGKNISEVFVRFEGKTPWKKVGEVVADEGNFDEAVRCQWQILIRHSYNLHRKVHFWLPTGIPVQFGYANEKAEIVNVAAGPLPLGTLPSDLKVMLEKCGFEGAVKPNHWRHMRTKAKDAFESKKDFHRKKPHLMLREYNTRVQAHKWYDPNKYRGRYMYVQRGKRGIVPGTGASR